MSKGINKPVYLSEELADFMNKASASRAQITKKIWDYIKENDLQDPDNRRMIIPDEVLAPILGKKPISMFKIATAISNHVVS